MMKRATTGLRAVVLSLLVLAFVTGASAGVVGDRLIARQPRLRIIAGDMSTVFDRLRLTAAQRVRADSIVARSSPRTHAIMLDAAERLRAVADSVDAELRAILTPDQQRLLDSLRVGPQFTLKRKIQTPSGTAVETLLAPGMRKR